MRKIWILFLIVFISCKKEELSLIDKWVLIDGQVYVEDLNSGKKYHYDHFNVDKNISYLTYINQYKFDIEIIEKYKTTWEFKENGDFILNNDIQNKLEYTICGDMVSILSNSTNRPIQAFTDDYKNGIIKVVVQEQYGSENKRNIRWINILYFQQERKFSIN